VENRQDLYVPTARLSELTAATVSIADGRRGSPVTVRCLGRFGLSRHSVTLGADEGIARELVRAAARWRWYPLVLLATAGYLGWLAFFAWQFLLGARPVDAAQFTGLQIALVAIVLAEFSIRWRTARQHPAIRWGQVVIRDVHPTAAKEWTRLNPFVTARGARSRSR
jgi:hypothetical protein